MKKNVKNRKPNSRLKSKRYSKKKVKQPQILGIGPKIINSILIGLNEGDFIHVRKIVDGLDEYELASLIESLSLHDRQKLVEVLGDRINPEVFPELNEVVQEQIIESLDESVSFWGKFGSIMSAKVSVTLKEYAGGLKVL